MSDESVLGARIAFVGPEAVSVTVGARRGRFVDADQHRLILGLYAKTMRKLGPSPWAPALRDYMSWAGARLRAAATAEHPRRRPDLTGGRFSLVPGSGESLGEIRALLRQDPDGVMTVVAEFRVPADALDFYAFTGLVALLQYVVDRGTWSDCEVLGIGLDAMCAEYRWGERVWTSADGGDLPAKALARAWFTLDMERTQRTPKAL